MTKPTKALSRAGLELEPIGESVWAVTRSGEPVAELGFAEFKDQGPSASLVIGKSQQGSRLEELREARKAEEQ